MAELELDMLEEVTGSCLEDAAFVFVERTEEDWEEDKAVQATVPFRCPESRDLILGTTEAFAASLAANLLGVDEESEEAFEAGPAALSEMANIIVGVLLARLECNDSSCGIGIPSVTRTTAAAHNQASQGAACALPLLADDEHRFDVFVR